MIARRAFLAGLAGLGVAGGCYAADAYRSAVNAGEVGRALSSSVVETAAGRLEYGVVGNGPPVLILHGTGGGFDQGLLFANRLRQSGFRIVAPSRFGYLRSSFPDDASPAHQADVVVELLNHLGIARLPVVGCSAGALTAAEVALRHPGRCSHLVLLVLLVPAAISGLAMTRMSPARSPCLSRPEFDPGAAIADLIGAIGMTWRKVVLTEFGTADCLELQTIENLPEPQGAEVRIRILVTSAAFTDVMIRKGLYPDVKERPPFTPGYDLVGVVDATGPGATRFRPGDRVADLTTIGAYAEYICRPEGSLTPVPDGVSEVDALGMILSAVAPYQMLHRVAKAKAGQSLLIHGAGGAVGTAMLQLAKDAGIAAFGTDIVGKHALIRGLGATPIKADASDEVLREAVGAGVDAVFDPLGGASLSRSLHALRPGGMLVAFGFQNEVLGRGGSIPMDFVKLKLWDWLPNGHATALYSIGAMRRAHPNWFGRDLAELFNMLVEGRIDPVVAEVLSLDEVSRAHEMVEAGKAQGKIVLRVGTA
ncbi:NADPH:quinone reductase [Jannaschia faecimaris]|uniref:NADPH:quinone reductase n=1 Tax=Jannaschia faecimaris TaxID=1244108 RepID=A0A1H3Q0R2_9RHOB|nr:alpha/beta fold hydrolase [Jannaschia faecimaris]SDZ06823.1 NADPH:quinone reductase [Jannaschia faecimaris]